MEQSLPNQQLPQQNMPQNPKPDHFSKIAFWKVGIIEVLAGVFILLLIFGVLNYFNILPLSDMFPKYLSFLPRQQLEKQRINTNRITPTTMPDYAPAPSHAIQDTEMLLNDVVNSSLIPDNLAFEKQNVENPHGYTFYGTGWKTQGGEAFIITIEYDQTENLIDRQIAIHIPLLQTTENLNSLKSLQIVNTYLKFTPKTSFACVQLPPTNAQKSIFCEAFWEDEVEGIKKGINIISSVRGIKETKVFYCEHHKGAPAYSWKSCDLRYKDTGIVDTT